MVPSVGFQGIDEAAQAVAALRQVGLQVAVHLKHAEALADAAQLGDIDGGLLDVDGLLVQQLPLCTQQGSLPSSPHVQAFSQGPSHRSAQPGVPEEGSSQSAPRSLPMRCRYMCEWPLQHVIVLHQMRATALCTVSVLPSGAQTDSRELPQLRWHARPSAKTAIAHTLPGDRN